MVLSPGAQVNLSVFPHVPITHGIFLWECSALTLPQPSKTLWEHPLCPRPTEPDLSGGMWPGILQGVMLSSGKNHRLYQGFANSDLWAKPSPQAVSVSPVILEFGSSLCVLSMAAFALPLRSSVDTCLSSSYCSNIDSGSLLLKSFTPKSHWGGGTNTLFVLRRRVTELWVPAISVQKGYGKAPS